MRKTQFQMFDEPVKISAHIIYSLFHFFQIRLFFFIENTCAFPFFMLK